MKKLLLTALFFLLIFPAHVSAGGLNQPENLRLVRLECEEYPKASAFFEWDPVKFATSYRFYSKVADGTDSYRSYEDDPEVAEYQFVFNPTLDFYVAVASRNTFQDEPPTESDKTEYFLSASKVLDLCAQEAGKKLPTPQISPSENPEKELSAVEKKDLEQANKKVKELEDKLTNLEDKVEETQKKQSFLEGLVNRILSFLRLR